MPKKVMSNPEAACVYAALILQDEGLQVSVENIEKIISASGLSVANIYPKIFVKALEGKNIKDFFFNLGSSDAVPIADGGSTAGGNTADKEKEKESEEEEEEESDIDLVFGLFD